MPCDQVHCQALAKINLSLSVGSPTSNGMHPIVSRMARVAFGDEVEVTRLEKGDLSRYAIFWHEEAPHKSPIQWSITSDLAVRAHRAIESCVGHLLPIQLKLQKRIPIGGGLGGGSADAAAMLQAVAKLYELDLDLPRIGATLGSDIPFLVSGGSAIVSGLGEKIEHTACEELHLVLMMPSYGCPTGDVYDAFDNLGMGCLDIDRVNSGAIFNDLLPAASKVAAELAIDISTIEAIAEAEVHLSGSGSTIFVICDNAKHAEILANTIREETSIVAIATNTCESKEGIEEKT